MPESFRGCPLASGLFPRQHRSGGDGLDDTARRLWREHARFGAYPAGVLPVPRPIAGTAFFPGGFGLFDDFSASPPAPFPHGGVMILGHDFHSEEQYYKSLERGYERPTQPTWRHLLDLLKAVAIAPSGCFFTNFFMGLRQGRKTTGVFPGADSASFVAFCRRFLVRQLAVQKPRLILTLGIHTPFLIAPMAPQLAAWSERRGLKYLDAAGPVRIGVTFDGVPGLRTTIVALTHPCLRPASVRHRQFGGLGGAAAEHAMVAAAKAAAGLCGD